MTGSRGRGMRVCALMVPVVLGMSGCAGSGAASSPTSALAAPTVVGSLPGPTGSASPSGTTTATSPVASTSTMNPDVLAGIPAEARVRTAKGAEAFVRYYLDVYNDVMVHPRQNRLMPLSEPTCKTCANWIGESDALVADGHRYAAHPVKIKRVFASTGVPEADKTFSVFVPIDIPAAVIVDRAQKTVRRYDADFGLLEFQLSWSSNWRVAFVRVVETKK